MGSTSHTFICSPCTQIWRAYYVKALLRGLEIQSEQNKSPCLGGEKQTINYTGYEVVASTMEKNSVKGEECSVQLLSHVRLSATLWTAAHQASLFITSSQSLPKPMFIESVMPSNHPTVPFSSCPQSFPGVSVNAAILKPLSQGRSHWEDDIWRKTWGLPWFSA